MAHVYIIRNNIDDRVYIGSSINVNKRWLEHKRDLINKKHHNQHLQRFINKYGIDSIKFDILEECSKGIVLVKEEMHFKLYENKFNIATNARAPMTGKHHTPESKEKIAKHARGSNNPMFDKKRPKELINKIKITQTGRVKTHYEKVKRMIFLPNRKELIIHKGCLVYYCFSINHAAKIINVSQQSVSSGLQKGNLVKGWNIKQSHNKLNKQIALDNYMMFDGNLHPQLELVQILQDLT